MERDRRHLKGSVFGLSGSLQLGVQVRVVGVGFLCSGVRVGVRRHQPDRGIVQALFVRVLIGLDRAICFGCLFSCHSDLPYLFRALGGDAGINTRNSGINPVKIEKGCDLCERKILIIVSAVGAGHARDHFRNRGHGPLLLAREFRERFIDLSF